jgi:predicted metal-dependent phosphoesterase TrpH
MSDGSGTPQVVIDRYHALGYTILALTDEDTMGTECTTWPWQAFDRDPETLAMVAIEGNEISRVDNIGSYFNDYGDADIDSEDAVIKEIGRRGGLAVLFHPGRYTKPMKWYLKMYRAYPHLIALEIYNLGDRYPNDRKTWDAILTDIGTERPVWGVSNDDMHNPRTQLGRNWNIMLLPELSRNGCAVL